jgi:hypothetical protein
MTSPSPTITESLRQHAQAKIGTPLYWGRVEQDGRPFAGRNPPALRPGEAEQILRPAAAFYSEAFDLSQPAEAARYNTLMQGVCNGIYIVYFVHRAFGPVAARQPPAADGNVTYVMPVVVYVEYGLQVMEERSQNAYP